MRLCTCSMTGRSFFSLGQRSCGIHLFGVRVVSIAERGRGGKSWLKDRRLRDYIP